MFDATWVGAFHNEFMLFCVFLDSSAFWIWQIAEDNEHFLFSAMLSAMSSSIWRRREGTFLMERA